MAKFAGIGGKVRYGFHGFPTVPENRKSHGISAFAGSFFYGSLYITPSPYVWWGCIQGDREPKRKSAVKALIPRLLRFPSGAGTIENRTEGGAIKQASPQGYSRVAE